MGFCSEKAAAGLGPSGLIPETNATSVKKINPISKMEEDTMHKRMKCTQQNPEQSDVTMQKGKEWREVAEEGGKRTSATLATACPCW